MKKLLPAICVMICFYLVGCIKDDTIVIEPQQPVFVNKKWQLTGMTMKIANEPFSNRYDSLPSFRRDDYFLFNPDSTYELNDNKDTIPGKNSKILDAGTWILDRTNTNLQMHSTVFNTTYTPAKIIQLNTTTLSLERTQTGDGSVTVTTYKALN